MSQFFVGLVVPENLSPKSPPNIDTHTDKQTDTCTYIHTQTHNIQTLTEREGERQTDIYIQTQTDRHTHTKT